VSAYAGTCLAEFAKQFTPGEMLKHASDILICGRSTEDFL
jgi:hypothetical protein